MATSDSLTLREIDTIENFTGRAIDNTDENSPKGKYLIALVYVLSKRTNPDFTFEDAMDMTMDEVSAVTSQLNSGDESGE